MACRQEVLAAGACGSVEGRATSGGSLTAAVPSSPAVAAAAAAAAGRRSPPTQPAARDSARTPTKWCEVASRTRERTGATGDRRLDPGRPRPTPADCRQPPPAPIQLADSRTSRDEEMKSSLSVCCCVPSLLYLMLNRTAVDSTQTD